MTCTKFSAGSIRESRGASEPALCTTKFKGITRLNQFNLQRPRFLTETNEHKQTVNVVMPENNRGGTGNFEMRRNNFIAPPIRGREMLDFEKLQAQDIASAGVKVQLGDKTIEKLFKIQVEDPTDLEWIAEYKARRAAGESKESIKRMPPFGRPQRQITRMRNIGQIGQNLNNDIETLSAAVLQNATENKAEIGQVVATLAKILSSEENIKQLTEKNLEAIKKVSIRVAIPADYRVAGFKQRIFSKREYKENQGLINLFLLSNLPPGRTLDNPLVKVDEKGKITSRPTLVNLIATMSTGDGSFLDLETREVIPRVVAISLVESGVDEGKLDGQEEPEGGFPLRPEPTVGDVMKDVGDMEI